LNRRKGEIIGRMNERDYPHIVELPLPSSGFRSQSDDMLAFHRERGIALGAAAGGTTTNSTTSAIASPIRRMPTPSGSGSVGRG
jgi:hypothetical protein